MPPTPVPSRPSAPVIRRPGTRRRPLAAGVAALAAFAFASAAHATTFYWTGASAGNAANNGTTPALWTSTIGGTNWSSLQSILSDPGSFPTSADDVFFVFSPLDTNTALGQNFSIRSLNFTSDSIAPVTIGGANTLTIGAGGLTALAGSAPVTISANVSLGAAQTWTSNTAVSSETLGGSFHAGDVVSTVVDGVTVNYTVQSADTNLSGVAIGIANAINATASLAGLVNATTNGAIVSLSGYQGVATLSTSVSGAGATTTATSVAGSAITVSGALGGSGPLTLQGTGSTQTPSGNFVFSGAGSSYNGAITLLNANTSLTVNGNGTLGVAAALNLGGGTVFTLDNTGTNVPNRLSSSIPVSSNGGTVNLLGSSSAASADQIGVLSLTTGGTNISVTPGSGQAAALTIASLSRTPGSGVNFSSTGIIALTSSTLNNGILGPWATIGSLTNNGGSLDFATVSGTTVVAYSGYDTNPTDLTTAGTAFAASNIKLTAGTAVLAGSSTINTLYMSGTSGIQINAAGANTTTLTIGAGGIIANGGTANYSLGNGQAEVNNATWIGGPNFSGGTTAATNTENQAGNIAVPSGVPDLVVTVGGISNPVTGLLNGALQLNVKNILDTTTALGTRTAVTANNSTTVTLTSGTTAGLYPGVQITGLAGTFSTPTNQTIEYVVGVIDATHFTIGTAPTTGAGSTTATFVGHTGLTKDGGGLLDIGDGNANNKTVAYSFQGDVTVNGGILLVGNDANLGVIPANTGFNPAAITLNGGELRSTAGLSFNGNRGITVGPQGGTITYVGGSTLTLTQKITGPGGLTFCGDSYNTATGLVYNISNTVPDTYQGPTIIEVKNVSTMNITTANALPSGTALTLSLPPNFQMGTNGAPTALTGFGALNLTSTGGLTIGSLASAASVTGANLNGTVNTTLTIGGNSASPVTQSATFNGVLTNSANTLNVIKNGGGNQTFTGLNTYAGTTTINGGAIIAANGLGSNAAGSATGKGAVTINAGGTLGSASGINGFVTGLVTVASGGQLAPTAVGSGATTLELNGGLTLSTGFILTFNLGAINAGTNPIAVPTSDNILVTGALGMTDSGTDFINLSSVGAGLTVGTYHLITATSMPADISGITFSIGAPHQFLYSVVDNLANNSLDLVVTTNPNPSLSWVGAPGNGTWNSAPANTPWTFTGSSGSAAYADGANLTFDNTPGSNAAISIPANVAPGSITFNDNALVNYAFSGAGAITGTLGFTKANTGSVTFNNVNTFTGAANIQAGAVVVGATGALADASFAVSNGATFTVNGALTATGAAINNDGAVIFNNAAQTLGALTDTAGGATGTVTLNGTALTLNGVASYDGMIGGTGSLTVSGGTTTLTNGGNSYGGGTTVSGSGTLVLSNTTGSATGGGAIGVGVNATLVGTGFAAGAVSLNGTLLPAGAGTIGTITLGSLTINGGAVLNFDFAAPGTSDNGIINGALTLAGNETLTINALAGFNIGTYTLFTAAGAINDGATFTFNAIPPNPLLNYSVLVVGNTVQLTVIHPTVTWTGLAGSGGAAVWDTSTPNWTPAPTGTYVDPDFVIFDDSGINTNITVTTTVNPGGITFNNSAAVPYTIGGLGFGGGGILTKNNNGIVILTGANSYTGGTVINAGTLQLGDGTTNGTFGTGTYSIAAAGTLALKGASVIAPTWANITGAGKLELNSTVTGDWGTPTLPAGFTGTLQIDVGHVASIATGASVGAATAIVVGGGLAAGAGGQFDASLGGTFAEQFTISGSGFGSAGLESALRLAGTGLTSTLSGPVALSSNATIGAAGTAILSGVISGANTARLTAGTSAQTGTIILSGTNTYAGPTTAAFGTLQFANPNALYTANQANWTPANLTVASGATLAVNVGGPADFTTAQVSALIGNLATVNSNGFESGSAFKFDTTNATAPVTFSAAIQNPVGPGAGIFSIAKAGPGTLNLTGTNGYTGTTSVSNGELILSGPNTGTGTVSAVNTTAAGTTVLSLRNSNALGSGSVNSALAPVTLNATGNALSASILEIGATIGTDPGGNNADFSYQVVAPGNPSTGTATPTNVVAGNGQINLGYLNNNDDGTGFAGYNATFTGNNFVPSRVVALYTPVPGSTTLATLEEKAQFGQGGGDHFTMGSPTANTTVVLMNPIDLNGGTSRRWASIRGVGITPEGEYLGAIVNSNPTNDNFNFDGNGGLIFANAGSTYVSANLQINGGAVFVAASDPAQTGQTGALGEGTATLQIGTSTTVNPAGGEVATTAGAHVGFMTYGPNAGVGPAPTEITNRNIAVGGTGVVYNSVVLGGVTDDYSAMNGNIALNEVATAPTTFTARNGGRVDFGGVISGVGSVVIGNSIVEGDATTAGIALNGNGTIVFNGQDTYAGSTTITAGKLYVNGSTAASSAVSVGAGTTLGGKGLVSGPVTVASGGNIEAGQGGIGSLTLTGGLTFSANGSITFPALGPVGNPGILLGGTLTTSATPVAIDITGSISAVGNYALIAYFGASTSAFSLSLPLPNRAAGVLNVDPGNSNELDLDVTSIASIVWTGGTNTKWDTSTANWVQQGAGSTQYIDNPGDSVIFDDSAAPHTTVSITGADVHPGSVNFNNNSSIYTISGTNAIAGGTGLNVNGTGAVILTNTNTFTGPTSIVAGGTLQLGNGTAGSDGSISNTSGITDNGALIYKLAGSQTYGGIIGGAGTLAVQGAGTLILTNANTYSGGTTVTTGTLQLGNGTVSNDGSVTGSVIDNGVLAFDYFSSPNYDNPINGTGGVSKLGAGTLTLTASSGYLGATTVTGGALVVGGTGALTGTASLSVGSGAVFTVTAGGSVPDGIAVTDNGTVNFNNPARSLLSLNGTNAAAQFNLNGTALAVTNGGAFAGKIQGSGSLTSSGGTLTLSGANSYTGATTINGGAVVVSGSISATSGTGVSPGASLIVAAGGSVTGGIADSGTVGGLGSVTGTLTAVAGTVAPGLNPATPGTFTLANLSLDSASTLSIALGGTSPGQFGQVAAGVINLDSDNAAGATLSLSLVGGFVPATGSLFVIGLNSGPENGVFQNTTPATAPGFFGGASFPSITVGGHEFAVSYNATATSFSDPADGGTSIALMAVPEPGSLGMLFASLGLTLGLQRFRRRV